MSKIRENHENRIETIVECLRVSDECAGKGDYYGCGAWASEARDAACVGRMLAIDLGNVIGERDCEAAAVWFGYAEKYGEFERAACAVIADCEAFLRG
ncbi:MAG: hypothetical protein AMXMBFR16_13170 [Candidatus Uhrbacteria bacterium]